jgi:hypothetical protein
MKLGTREGCRVAALAATLVLPLALGACTSMSIDNPFASAPPAEPPPPPEIPASIRAEELVGRWGLAAFHNANDRPRTEAAARNQCKQPYVIGAGPTGGVIMHLADEATPLELRLTGSQTGRNYIGPPGPAGADRDREILSFDGRVLVTRFVEKDAGTRYGNMVYVRCAPRA